MPETAELTELAALHRTLRQLRGCVERPRSTYGDIPAVKRLIGDVDRIELDASELDPVSTPAVAGEPVELSDEPVDPSLWADADDEGLGGYHRGSSR
jgi:hypothetical protein